MTLPFDRERFRLLRRQRGLSQLGEPLIWSAQTGSTNDDALLASRSGAETGTTFLTEQQTRGRGRFGRTWYAEPGASLLFSTIVRQDLPLDRLACLSLVTGISVRRALARCLPTLEAEGAIAIKWPNDIWLREQKVAGILVESQIEGSTLRAAVIGIGINGLAHGWPEELESVATAIDRHGALFDREQLLVDVLDELSTTLKTLRVSGLKPLLSELRQADALAGRTVRIAEALGVARGIDELGRLLVQLPTGAIECVSSGSVELCHPVRGA